LREIFESRGNRGMMSILFWKPCLNVTFLFTWALMWYKNGTDFQRLSNQELRAVTRHDVFWHLCCVHVPVLYAVNNTNDMKLLRSMISILGDLTPQEARTHMRVHTDTHIHTHSRTHTRAHRHRHTYTHMHIHMHTLLHTHTYTHTNTHTQTQTQTHTLTHTHTHTHAQPCVWPTRMGWPWSRSAPKKRPSITARAYGSTV